MDTTDGTGGARASWRLGLVALTMLAFALRAYRLAAQNLWSDEDITLDRTGIALSELISRLPIEHAPLYFVLMRGWTLLAGDGDLALRFPSLVAGVAQVPLAAFLGARLVSRRAGMVAALIVAINPFLIWYAQEARMYALVSTFAMGSLAAVVMAERVGGRRWWACAGALAAAAVLTHYYAAVIVFVLAGWAIVDLVASGRDDRFGWKGLGRRDDGAGRKGWGGRNHWTGWAGWKGWATLGGTAAILFLPWLPRAVEVVGFAGWREPVALPTVPWTALRAWSAGPTSPPGAARWAAWLYLVPALVGLVVTVRNARSGGPPAPPRPGGGALEQGLREPRAGTSAVVGARRILIYALVPVAIVTLLLLRTPDFHPRYMMAALPAFYLLVASGTATLPRAAATVMAAALVAGALPPLAKLYTDPAYQKQNYRSVIGAAERGAGQADTALILDGPPFGMMQRYRSEESPVKIVDIQRSSFETLDPVGLDEALAQRLADRDRLWLAEDGGKTGFGRRWMAAHACPVEETSVQDVTLGFYVHRPSRSSLPPRDLGPSPDGDVTLQVRPPVGAVRAGDTLPIEIVWHVRPHTDSGFLENDWKVSARVVDRSGAVVVAADRPPLAGTQPTTTWRVPGDIDDCHALVVPIDTPPGAYRLQFVLYDEHGAAPPMLWTDNETFLIGRHETGDSGARDVRLATRRRTTP